MNGTGTGELAISIDTVDGIPVGDAEVDCKSPGSYNVGWDLKAVPDPDCQEPPREMWLPGTYTMSHLVSVNKFSPPILRILLQLSAMGSVGASIPIAPSTIWHILPLRLLVERS